MLVDCQTCPVRDLHCADCMVTALTQLPTPTHGRLSGLHDHGPGADLAPAAPAERLATVPLDRAERRAVAALVAVGLVGHEVANELRAVPETGHRRPSFPEVERTRFAI